ncbi:MAG: GNAT family N-acetyltransferase [Acidiferrobacterales bacterium]
MDLSVVDSIAQVPATDWDRLVNDRNPFLRHAFLCALEETGCANAQTGWLPQHLLVHSDASGRGRLLGAVPMYLKTHSYGEYVFDWAWANAYQRARLRYYPKLVVAVPFTPATGPRLLVAANDGQQDIKVRLIQGALARAQDVHVSSLHWLFTPSQDVVLLERLGHMRRTGCQFHWHNRDYQTFDEFLRGFSSAKRKKVKQERRYVREAGVTIDFLVGDAVTPKHWDIFYQFYLSTIQNYGAIRYLSREFFCQLGAAMAKDVVLVLARQDDSYIAGALNLRGVDTLYGRYWGNHKYIKGLHFEVCYYSAMEYCIEHGIKRFEAGAQGEHKIARGFVPTTTYSAHWLSHPQFGRAVADFLAHERDGIKYYIDELNEHSPFKQHG